MLQAYLPRIGQSAGSIVYESCDDEVESLLIQEWGIGIDCGALVSVKRIGGTTEVRGYRVYYIKVHPGGRWNPPEEEDVTFAETISASDALGHMGALLTRQIADHVVMCTIPEY